MMLEWYWNCPAESWSSFPSSGWCSRYWNGPGTPGTGMVLAQIVQVSNYSNGEWP